jgi:hypothetical protein
MSSINDNRLLINTPNIILCSGIPRSGSTWLYNAARLLLEVEYPAKVYGCWIADYDPSRPAAVHIVKIHEFNDHIAKKARIILTSHRDLRDIAASAWLRGWVTNEQATLQFIEDAVAFHTYWLKLGAFDVPYNMIRNTPLEAIEQIATRLGISSARVDASSILAQLEALPMATLGVDKYNPTTLLHDRHRMDGKSGYYNEILPIEIIARIEDTFGTWLRTYAFIS